MKKIKSVFIVLFFTFIPGFAMYLAGEKSILDIWQSQGYIGPKVSLPFVKQSLRILSVGLTALYLSITREFLKNKLHIIEIQRCSLINNLKRSFLEAFQNKISNASINAINIRIFIEKKDYLRFLKALLGKYASYIPKKYYIIKNIDGLSNAGNTNNLQFEVSPNSQGLVGKCYNQKSIVYDEDLMVSEEDYNLNSYQRNKTCDIRFCLCAPIFGNDGEVVAIVAFDSVERITIESDDKNVWKVMITNYCQTLHENLPDLFK